VASNTASPCACKQHLAWMSYRSTKEWGLSEGAQIYCAPLFCYLDNAEGYDYCTRLAATNVLPVVVDIRVRYDI
jgi:hypothetical protein